MGCVDSFRVCNAHKTTCFDNSNATSALELIKSQKARNALFLLLYGLERSNAFYSVYLLPDPFNTTTESMFFYQDRVRKEQWKVEAEVLFQTSLARMQVDIFDLARGTYRSAGLSSPAVDKLPEKFRGACKMVAFHSEGYKNVSAIGFWGINLLCVLAFLGSRRYSNAERRAEQVASTGDGGFHDELWIIILPRIVVGK